MAQAKRSESKRTQELKVSNNCPFCGSIRIKKHRRSAKGTPRMICKDCGKMFSFGIDRLGQNSQLSAPKLSALYIGIVKNQTIYILVRKMNVSCST